MIIKELTDGKISGTGTISCPSQVFGGVVITTDGTNAATVVVQKTNSSGTKIFEVSTVSSMSVFAPIDLGTGTLYYDVSGTNAEAQLYMWSYRTK